MDLERVSQELYRLPPTEFTAARNAKAAEARLQGRADLATSLKKLRRPSVGAWLANLLVVEDSRDVDHLIDLGAQLRSSAKNLDGEQIRKVSKDKAVTVSKLARAAGAKASRMDQPASSAAMTELETTLEAAFADAAAAQELQAGRLARGLQYSGLGVALPTGPSSSGRPGGSSSPTRQTAAERAAKRRAFDRAKTDADRADAELAEAKRSVVLAERELRRLRVAEASAARRSRDAQKRAATARKKFRG